MRPIAFFLGVFLCMLTVFLLATGELQRWFSPEQGNEVRLVTRDASSYSATPGKNTLEFDFYNVKLGRRNFTIRAELGQGEFGKSGARIDELQEVHLKDGLIEVPVYEGKQLSPPSATEEGRPLDQILLQFRRAVYRREGGLTQGKGNIEVLLEDGHGTTNEGTEFYFRELRFSNDADAEGKDAYRLESSDAVTIDSRQLVVESPSGFTGMVRGRGIDKLTFLPPVAAYLDPGAMALFAKSVPDAPRNAAPKTTQDAASTAKEVVAITCQGPLELDFTGSAQQPPEIGPTAKERVKDPPIAITFEKDVTVYRTTEVQRGLKPPPPAGDVFKCQRLVLEVDTSTSHAVPTRALATWEGGRVRSEIVRGGKTSILECDELEWRGPLPENRGGGGGGAIPPVFSQAVFKGKPTLRGEGLELIAKEAVFRPEEDRLFLQDVEGHLKRARSRARVGDAPRPQAADLEAPHAGSRGLATASGDPRGTLRPASVNKRETADIAIDFTAEAVEMTFAAPAEGDDKTVSNLVARSTPPHGVVLTGRPAEGAVARTSPAVPPAGGMLRAAGERLTYGESKKVITLEGRPQALPFLSLGSSRIEAERIHLLREEGLAWFENRVSAQLQSQDFPRMGAQEPKDRVESAPPKLEAFALEAGYLEVRFEEDRDGLGLLTALARGEGNAPLTLRTLVGPQVRLRGSELQLDASQDLLRVWGDAAPSPQGRATLEFDGGMLAARNINLDRSRWRCELREDAEVRFDSRERTSLGPQFDLLADKADLEFLQGFSGLDSAGAAAGTAVSARGDSFLSRLAAVRKFSASGGEARPLQLTGTGFTLRGEEAAWTADSQELRFFGSGWQEIEVQQGSLSGPVRAKQVVYDARRQLLTLSGSVRGRLKQGATGRSVQGKEAAQAPQSQPSVWEFETSALDLEMQGNDVGGDRPASSWQLKTLSAHEKVLLSSRENGLQIRGDDLRYDVASGTVRVYSKDGRPQTVLHYKDELPPLERQPSEVDGPREPNEAEGRIDKILAQEIWVFLFEREAPTSQAAKTGAPAMHPGAVERRTVLHFLGDVICTFHPRKSPHNTSSGGDPAAPWKVVADRVTAHLNPSEASKGLKAILWALASSADSNPGNRKGSNVVITTGPYQATAVTAEYRESECRVTLVGNPASIAHVDRGLRESSPVIVISMPRDQVIYDKQSTVSAPEPWPGVPRLPNW
jgi:lipopolysaccharide export system protein LptA